MSTLNDHQTLYDFLQQIQNKQDFLNKVEEVISNQINSNTNILKGHIQKADKENDTFSNQLSADENLIKKYVRDNDSNNASNTISNLQKTIKNIQSTLQDLSNRAKLAPKNIFPNYWLDSSHNDSYTFHVQVQKGVTYTLSFIIANNPSNVPIRANSEWNIGDQWGDVVQDDSGVSEINNTYQITFTANQTGNMPIEFIHTNAAKAIQNGPSMMIKRITMTKGSYTPYEQCYNGYQSISDVTGDAGMNAKDMFGNL